MQEFVQCIGGPSSIYGFCEDTLDSLLLTVLPVGSEPPPTTGIKLPLQQPTSVDIIENEQEKQTYILQMLTEALRQNFRFHFHNVSHLTFKLIIQLNRCYVVLGCFCFHIPQCPAEEMKHDAECLFRLVLSSNPNFVGVMNTEVQNVETAKAAIHSALDALQRDHIDFMELSPVTQFIWSLLVQWLVRHFCKQLIQLMTPEALVLHAKQIPASYIQCYLSYQKHFSLKDLIQQQLDKAVVQGNRYEVTLD